MQPQELLSLGWTDDAKTHMVPNITKILQMSKNVRYFLHGSMNDTIAMGSVVTMWCVTKLLATLHQSDAWVFHLLRN